MCRSSTRRSRPRGRLSDAKGPPRHRSRYTQTLNDAGVLGSIGTVGDAYDDAVAESFVDSFKTELIADRARATRSQLELAVVEYVAWFNNERLHETLEDRPPREVEDLYAAKSRPTTPIK
jgi:transposase InsO family protein